MNTLFELIKKEIDINKINKILALLEIIKSISEMILDNNLSVKANYVNSSFSFFEISVRNKKIKLTFDSSDFLILEEDKIIRCHNSIDLEIEILTRTIW